jgi:hypothetical protein
LLDSQTNCEEIGSKIITGGGSTIVTSNIASSIGPGVLKNRQTVR